MPNVKEVETTYVERLESRSEEDSSAATFSEIASDTTYGILTELVVREAVQARKPDTAGGPDMIRFPQLHLLASHEIVI